MRMYDPTNYSYLREDMEDFYRLLDLYLSDKTKQNYRNAEIALRHLFFALKADMNAGNLSKIQFDEMLEYFKGELYGKD